MLYLLTSPSQQPKKGQVPCTVIAQDLTWLLYWPWIMLPAHWTCTDLGYPTCYSELFRNIYLDLTLSKYPLFCLFVCFFSKYPLLDVLRKIPCPNSVHKDPNHGSSWPTLILGNSWFGHLVWAFCLIIITPHSLDLSNLVLSLVPVSLFLKSLPPGFGPRSHLTL